MSATTTFEHMIDPDRTVARAAQSRFCWSKYGVEAGEPVDGILARKEAERLTNDGVFLWGIGSNVRNALRLLVREEPDVNIRFSAMRSRPKPHDQSPSSVVVWREGETLDGLPYELSGGSVVTSRASRSRHFALVCQSDRPLREADQPIDSGRLRNFVSGAPVGHSQVTAVVRSSAEVEKVGPQYARGFTARLVYPYLVSFNVGYILDGAQVERHKSDLGALMSIRDAAFESGSPWMHAAARSTRSGHEDSASMLNLEAI